ncbi:MAG TPA: hypothetical protein VJB87_00700, partial [Candidatus Nanoarchaeia archaeon]|nr:hypothetical protein [Candidatus Nanoarchaeia archaeon]
STFGSNKQKYGSSMNSRLFTTQRADAYCRATLHNLSLVMQPEIFNSTEKEHKIKKDNKEMGINHLFCILQRGYFS